MEDSFGAIVKRARRARGWKQGDLARRMGVGQQAVSSWERGVAKPVDDDLARLAEELAIDPALLRGTVSPGAAGVTPPVRPRLTTLPFDELHPDVFEQFSLDLAKALHSEADVHRQGGQGHTQYGVDIVIEQPDGRTLAIQCKRVQKFGPAKIAEAVRMLTTDVDHTEIFLTRVASPQARAEIAKHTAWSLRDAEDLSAAVRTLADRDSAVRLIDTYFPGWRESFLGVAVPGPWLSADEFFRPFSQGNVYSHTWQLVGREAQLSSLRTWATGAGDNGAVAMLLGRGGIGKTRLLRSLADTLADHGLKVRFLDPNAVVEPEHLELFPRGDLIVIIDDAHDRTDIAQIVSGLCRFRPDAKVLLSLRPYAKTQVLSELRKAGRHQSEIPTNALEDLTVAEGESLASAVLGADAAPAIVRRLAAIAPDCPLLIVVGAGLVSRGLLDPMRLEASDDIRSEILRAFGDVLAGAPHAHGAQQRREVLDMIAVLQPFRLDQADFRQAASNLIGRPFDQILPHVRGLQEAGALIRRDESVRVVPDLLGDVLLAQASVDGESGISTGYLDRVCKAVSGEPLRHAVVNASRVDWQTHNLGNGRGSAVAVLWKALYDAFEAGTESDRVHILDAVRQVAVLQPCHTMTLVDKVVETLPDEADGATAGGRLILGIPGILHRVALNRDYLGEAADKLWSMARTDIRPPHQHPEHPIRVLTDLAEYGVDKPDWFQRTMIEAAQRWLHEIDVADHPYSPLTVLEPLLATEFEERISDGFALALRGLPVDSNLVAPLRERVVDLAFAEARAGDLRRAVRGVQTLGSAISYPNGMFGRVPDDAELASWTPGFIDILQRMERFVREPALDPVVIVAVRKVVEGHAKYWSLDTTEAARAVLDALPEDIDCRLAHVLHDGWGPSLPDMEEFNNYYKHQQDLFARLAADMSMGRRAEEVADHLIRRLAVEHQVHDGGTTAPGQFVRTLVEDRPDVGAALVNRALSMADVPSDLVTTAFSTLVETAPSTAILLMDGLLNSPVDEHIRVVAHALSWGRGTRTELFDGEGDLIRSLLTHDDFAVRKLALAAARTLGNDHQDLARELLISALAVDSEALVVEIATMLVSPGYLHWTHLTTSDLGNLIDRLRSCPSLDDHHISKLLGELSAAHPEEVLELLISRIEIAEGRDLSDFQPLPFRWMSPLRLNESTKFESFLRRVLNWIAQRPDSWRRTWFGSRVFKEVSVRFDDVVLKVLSDAMKSGQRQQVHAVASVLREAPRDFAWTRVEFVVEALRIAERIDEQAVQAIGEGLHAAATQGFRTRTPGRPSQSDEIQRDEARSVAERLPAGSIEHRFFSSLAEAAESQIQWHLDRDDRMQDRRPW